MLFETVYSTIASSPLQKHHHHPWKLFSSALMWMTESSQCYMTHWVVLRNWSSQLSPHQVGCKLEVWGKGTCESSQELQLQQETFLGNVCAEAEEQKLEEGTPEKSLSGLDCAFRKNAVKKKIGTMSKETAYFFVYMLNSLVFKEEFSVLCKKVCIKAPSISFFFFSFFSPLIPSQHCCWKMKTFARSIKWIMLSVILLHS